MLIFYLSLVDSDRDKRKLEAVYDEYRERMYDTAFEILENREDATHEKGFYNKCWGRDTSTFVFL